ncbi:MAG: hypothetical protein PQJ46_12640, partial [Spirochaetales bacterium]|nr:hypothetical protein [Spirochaetales bacterium]
MNNILIISALNITEYAFKEIYDGKTSVDLAVSASNSFSDVSKKVVIVPEKMDSFPSLKGFELCNLKGDNSESLIRTLSKLSEGFDNIFYYNIDCPLIDPELFEKMYSNHKKYFCEYTFADGYPLGISVEIIKTSI